MLEVVKSSRALMEKSVEKNNAIPANPHDYWVFELSVIIPYGHTCATLLVMHGISLFDVSKWLGHSTMAITEKFYIHFDVKSQIEPANKMGEILSLNISNDVKDNLSKYEEELITPI